MGAGLSGLAAARTLTAAGHDVVVFEKSRGLGGRLASRRVGDAVVDHGAPALDVPAGSALADLVAQLGGTDLVRVGAPTVGAATVDAPLVTPVAFADGLTQLAKRMAADLRVERGVRIAAIRGVDDGYELGDEQGNGQGRFHAVVVSAPAAQAADLLERSPEPRERVAALRALRHHPAVMAVVGARLASPPAWFVTHPADGILATVTVESWKGRVPLDGVVPLVARLTPAAAAEALDAHTDQQVLDAALPAVAATLGVPDLDVAWSQVKRWRFSTVEARGDFDALNPPGTRIVVCGDSVAPAGMAAVFDSGVDAATRLIHAG